jgi:hypothetical protein
MEFNNAMIFRNAVWQYPDNWPPEKFFVSHASVTRTELAQFESLLDKNSSETELDKFLRANPSVLVNSLRNFSTGHHGAWVISQQQISPSMTTIQKGLIPDFIVGGCNSDGFSWFVLELKGADQKMLQESNNYLYFSPTVNKAVGQIIEYLDYCASAQSYLRDSLHLTGFREPKGLIIVGRETEFANDLRREKFKSAWNRFMSHKIEIRTYDAILRYVRSEVELKENTNSGEA